jgi:ATP-dependent exoDNAse (exonuclease V) beta subunit (contains helicase and exonuclease domains)
MSQHAYHLQYLLYTVAVHRYLRLRLTNYDYDVHFGGVFYLFLRGMDPALGSDYGIFRDRPGRTLVDALCAYFATRKDAKPLA